MVYGLKDAAMPWYRSVVDVIQELGSMRSKLDPTVFYLKDKKGGKGVMCSHVDDFFFMEGIQILRR